MIPTTTRRPRLLLGALLLLASAAPASAQNAIAWNFKKGQVLKYDFVQKNDIKVLINGEERSTVSDLDLDLTWTVDEVKDGVATITQTIDNAKVNVKTSAGDIAYDSASKTNAESAKEIGKVYDNVIGEKYTLVVNKMGELQDVKVPAKVEAALKESPFAAVADSGSIFSPKGVKVMMTQVLPKLPEKAVKVGETWNGSLDLPGGPLQMKLDTTFSLKGLDKDKADIEGKITTTVKASAPLTVEIKKQDGRATFVVDAKDGVMTSSTIKHAFEMVMTANGQQLSQTIAIDASMKLKK